ncbi:MAG: conjugal transfer protein TraF [Armatimonadota bacterium]
MRFFFAVLVLVACLAMVSAAQAQTPWSDSVNQIRSNTGTGLGARSLGMGGAFTAVADGPTAVYWNPAGLAWNQGWQTEFSITGQVNSLDSISDAGDLYDAIRDIDDNPTVDDFEELYNQAQTLSGRPLIADFSASVLSMGYNNIAVGIWAQAAGGAELVAPAGAFDPTVPAAVATNGDGLGYATAGLGYGHKVKPNFGVGITAKFIEAGRADANFTALYDGAGNVTTTPNPTNSDNDDDFGIDLGLIYEPQPEVYCGRVRLGAMVRNINSPSFAIGIGGSEIEFEPTVNVGLAVRSANDRALFAFDLHNLTGANDTQLQVCAGLEYEVANWLILRVGSFDGEFTKGLSAYLGSLRLSAAIGSSWDELASLSLDWGF